MTDFNRILETTKYWYGNHTHNIIPYTNPPPAIYTFSDSPYYWRKDHEMTTIDKVASERKEARERERIEIAYQHLDALDLDVAEDGAVIRFNVEEGTKVLTYAALHAKSRWWATGCTAPNGVPLEDLLAWMIRKNVILESVVVL